MRLKRITAVITVFLMLISISGSFVFADTSDAGKYRIGELYYVPYKTEDKVKIEVDDMHYGWELGHFYISGHTDVIEDESSDPVILKNVGDEVELNFELEQDLCALNDNEKLCLAESYIDTEGKNEITHQGFGILEVKQVDEKNNEKEPEYYENYLDGINRGGNTTLTLSEEGDYHIQLIYDVIKEKVGLDKKEQYTIFLDFSIRNGNCMAYPFELETGNELLNGASTDKGFYVDTAESKYLKVYVKKEVLVENENGYKLDTRYNRPVKGEEQFADEGVYTITIKNEYTEQNTEKQIYVGTNELLKSYVATGLTLEEVEKYIDDGADVDDDGSIVVDDEIVAYSMLYKSLPDKIGEFIKKPIGICVIVIAILALIGLFVVYRRRNAKR